MLSSSKCLSKLALPLAALCRNIQTPSKSAVSLALRIPKSHGILNTKQYFAPGSIRFSHAEAAQGDKELAEFLKEEIKLEAKTVQDTPKIPPGFSVKENGADLILTKSVGSENVEVRVNVNHSVDASFGGSMDQEGDEQQQQQQQQKGESNSPEMMSKPAFSVKVTKGDTSLIFNCTMLEGESDVPEEEKRQEGEEDFEDDIFQLEELAVVPASTESTGENVYVASAEIMDGEMYDRLMDYLADRGIDGDFCQQLMTYCTSYEAGQYVSLLKKLHTFIEK